MAGVSDWIGIGMKPEFAAPWLYERMVWGGIWMLLVVLPSMGKGLFGLVYGAMMPVVVVVLNFIYGIFASLWYSQAR